MLKKIINFRQVPSVPDQKMLKEVEITGLLYHVREEINSIHLDMDNMSDEQLTIQTFRLDAMEKSYYALFNKLRVLRGLDSFETVAERLKESPNYDELNQRYKLDQIGKHHKFLSGFNYNHLPAFHFDESE